MSDSTFLSLSLVPLEGRPGHGEAEVPAPAPQDGIWPAVPAGQFAAAVEPAGGYACEVEGLNGRIMRVQLQKFDLANGLIDVISSGLRAPMQLRFAQFRRLSLVPLLGVRQAPATHEVLSYQQTSRSGDERRGFTVGFVDGGQGVFLFEPADDSGAVRRHFIPATAYQTLTIGDVRLEGQAPPPPRPVASISGLGPLTEPGGLTPSPSSQPSALPGMPAAIPAFPTTAPAPVSRPSPAGSPVARAVTAPAPDFAMFKLDLEPKPTTAPAAARPAPVAPPASTAAAGPRLNLADRPATMAAGSGPGVPGMPGVRAGAAAAPAQTAQPVATKTDTAAELLAAAPVATVPELIAALDRQASMPLVRLGEALIGLGLIDEKKLELALAIQRNDRSSPLGEILVRQGHIQRQDLQFALNRKMGYPLIDLDHFQPDVEALMKVPSAIAARLQVLPLHLRAGNLIVAMEDPTRSKALDELEFATALKLSPTLVKPGAIGSALETAYRRLAPDQSGIRSQDGDTDVVDSAELLASLEIEGTEGRGFEEERSIEQSDNSLVRMINQMILEAQNQGASDIHIETLPGKERLRIRFRRDGVLKPYLELPHTYRTALIARIKIMCDLDISEKRKPQDGKINFGKFHPGSRLELRVATIPTSNGLEDAVLRLLASAKTLPLDDVGLAPRPLQQLKSIVERPYGMFLCVGPTGSGKTTTLHSALGYINRPDRKIWTAEDPVEITQPGLRQVQVNPKIDWTFAKALRAFLRADPDVIMVGEIRDKETATVAVESSLTGHLVMSTLHTNSAPETVTRLLDMGMDPFNFADALLGVLAQRLVRRTCSHCHTSRESTSEEVDELLADFLSVYGHSEGRPSEDSVLADWRQRFGVDGRLMHHVGTGCDKCGGSGLRGRVGIHELMVVSRQIRQLIQTGARVDELQRQALAEGMLTLRQDGIEKVLQGFTTLSEVRASSN